MNKGNSPVTNSVYDEDDNKPLRYCAKCSNPMTKKSENGKLQISDLLKLIDFTFFLIVKERSKVCDNDRYHKSRCDDYCADCIEFISCVNPICGSLRSGSSLCPYHFKAHYGVIKL